MESVHDCEVIALLESTVLDFEGTKQRNHDVLSFALIAFHRGRLNV